MEVILKNFELFLYIAIFVIAIVASALKKKPQAEEDANDTAPPEPASKPHRQPVPLDEEMRKTLDDIFSSKQPSPTGPQRTTYESQRQTHEGQRSTHEGQRSTHEGQRQAPSYTNRKNVNVNTRSNAQPQANKKLVRSSMTDIDEEWERTLNERKARDAARSSSKSTSAYAITPTSTFEDEQTILAQARNGIIWSEILQPPVSMR